MTRMKNHKTIERLLAFYGDSPTNAGRALNTTRQNVNLWREKGYVPARWASSVEKATGGSITAIEVMETAIWFQDPVNRRSA